MARKWVSSSSLANIWTIPFSSAVTPAFSPLNLANLLAWYKADTGVLNNSNNPAANGEAVKTWQDQSGNNYHVIGPAFQQARFNTTGFNGLNSVYFDVTIETNYMKTTANTVVLGDAARMAFFVVGQLVVAKANNFGCCAGFEGNGQPDVTANAASCAFIRNGSNTQVEGFFNGGALDVATITDATNYRLASIWDGVNHNTYVNNVATGPTGSTFTLTTPGSLLVGGGDNSIFWGGPIAEVVVVNGTISALELSNLDSYFQTKWGL